MPDSERLFTKLDRMEARQDERHMEIAQRLTVLETLQQTYTRPCPDLKTILDERKEEAQWGRLKRLVDYAVKAAVVATAALFGSQVGK